MREVRGDEALILVIGNKKDLEDERQVPTSNASENLKNLGLTFMEVSAKTGANVKEFFKDLAFLTAGGKKSREEPSKPANEPQVNNQSVTLYAVNHQASGEKAKKGKCC